MNIPEIIIPIFTTWPVPVSLLVVFFVLLFRQQIGYFIKHRMKKVGPDGVEGESSESQIGSEEDNPIANEKEKMADFFVQNGIKTYSELEAWIGNISKTVADKDKNLQEKEKSIETYQSIVKALLERVKLFEFGYLSLFLVYNSKLALWWFQQQVSSTKELFLATFPLPAEIQNPAQEKEAIFSVLLSNGLIEYKNSLSRVTDKGRDFLIHTGLLKSN